MDLLGWKLNFVLFLLQSVSLQSVIWWDVTYCSGMTSPPAWWDNDNRADDQLDVATHCRVQERAAATVSSEEKSRKVAKSTRFIFFEQRQEACLQKQVHSGFYLQLVDG